jgi:aspartate/methionine/tyrosine aminotransferase
VSQAAAVAVLEVGAGYCRRYLPGLDAVRREALDQLAALAPFGRVPAADGAFYLLLHLDTDGDPLDIVHYLIREHGVAVIPGTTFGVHDRCTLRIAYGALQPETVAEGIGRLVTGLKALDANR